MMLMMLQLGQRVMNRRMSGRSGGTQSAPQRVVECHMTHLQTMKSQPSFHLHILDIELVVGGWWLAIGWLKWFRELWSTTEMVG
jgi:hypothetical protein